MTARDILDYEIRSSWWAPSISWRWAQRIAGLYFAFKVRTKYRRYRLNQKQT